MSIETKSSFDERIYLAANPDVADGISRGDFASAWEHFQKSGKKEGRAVNASQFIALQAERISHLQRREKELQNLSNELSKTINEIHLSTSWRITKPLRMISRWGRRIKRLIKLYQSYRQIFPGISGFVRLSQKCVAAIREGGLKGLRNTIYSHARARETVQANKICLAHNLLMLEDVEVSVDTLPADVAVHVHIYYPDLAPEIRRYLENIPVLFSLYVTTDTPEKAKLVEVAFSGMGNMRLQEIRVVENRGRDLAPMLVSFGAELAQHEVILHLHTKRSPHNAVLRGWRRYLLESLLGNPQRVSAILQQFARDPSLGILFPQVFNPVRPYMNIGGNYQNMVKLLMWGGKDGSVIESISKDYFPAGSMFWFRGKAMKPFVKMRLTLQDFDEEAGQCDATLAHAIERLFVYFAEDSGLHSQVYSTYQFDPNSSVCGFDWLKRYINNEVIKNPVIIFDHGYGGGTNTYSRILTDNYTANDIEVLRCIFRENYWLVEWIKADDGIQFATEDINELFGTLGISGGKKIIVNSLYGYPGMSRVVKEIASLSQSLAAPLEYKAHDFYCICPSPHLLNYKNAYCAIPQDHAVCSKCLKQNRSWYIKGCWTDDIDEWRSPFAQLIEAATTINFFDSSAIEIYRQTFHIEDNKTEVTPHVDNYFECNEKMDLSGPLHIGVLGTLTMVKGAAVVNELSRYIEEEDLPIPITVVGPSMLPTDPKVKILGPYKVDELAHIVRSNCINAILMPSIVPETFSYSISEAMKMGLPVVAFDIGAQGNRVKNYEMGKVVPLGSSPEIILAAIQSALNTAKEFTK